MKQALLSIPYKHDAIELFHSDRGSEFDNQLIDSVLNTFGIERSLSRKGNPYDNAVAESSFKCMKTEFIQQTIFQNIEELKLLLAEYVHWWNTKRLHSGLGYQTPKSIRETIVNT